MIRKIIRGLLLLICLGSLGYIGYQYNWLNVRSNVTRYQTTHQVAKLSHSKVSQGTRQRIERQIMRQTQSGQDLTKQGFVSIPNVGILQPIFNDAYSDKGLAAGANYANRSAVDPDGKNIPVMGQGNYGLASHNFNDGKTGFSALQDKLNEDAPYLVNGKLKGSNWLKGKMLYLANDKGIYAYKMGRQTLVNEDDVSVLNPTKKPVVTIISCLFPSTQYRIITNAKLTKTYTWQKAPAKVVNLFDLEKQNTNVHASWFNPGTEEGVNGDAGGSK